MGHSVLLGKGEVGQADPFGAPPTFDKTKIGDLKKNKSAAPTGPWKFEESVLNSDKKRH